MRETSKALKRRLSDKLFPWDKVFQGIGIDVGAADDPWPNAIPFNIPDGGGDKLTVFFSPQFKVDYVHASQVLEHALNPVVMLSSWIQMLKLGGYIVFTVPDLAKYEGCRFPSKHNAGHHSTWSMDIATSPAPLHCKMPEWLQQFGVEILRCQLILTNYDESLHPLEVDQTFDFERGTECSIEAVLRKP